ncbi:Hypp8923 [Branchiostoma lanceolatum]|uniref:Hypp8923 protein n=1 Tax=Branchiostoma lanceolatum TaxID=7740 RepID=A0A8J9ZCS6_BRALA|nr:Hypp8923 [Branchiostoma lanceolatum]
MASVLKVRCKNVLLAGREHPHMMTRLSDFVGYGTSRAPFSEGAREDVLDPADFLRRRGAEFSVYSVDFTRRLLGLVKVRSGVDITRAPFFFRAQRVHAEELLLIPFNSLPAVADAVRSEVAGVRNIFLHSTGRCGSTLMCKAIEATKEVQAVSEPDMYTSLFEYYQARGFQLTSSEEDDVMMVLRLRGFAVFIADLLQKAVPEAKTIFLYRDLQGYFDSWLSVGFNDSYWNYFLKTALRIDVFFGVPAMVNMEPCLAFLTENKRLTTYPELRGEPFFTVSSWLLRMQKAFDLIQEDPTKFFHACLRYNELVTHREHIVLKVLKQIGFDICPAVSLEMKAVFGRDSQEGTFLKSARRTKGMSGGSWVGVWERNLFSEGIEHFLGDVDSPGFILKNPIMG